MNEKILEGLLKTSLSQYRDSWKARNPEGDIDFAMDFFNTKVNPSEIAKKANIDHELKDQEIPVLYLRIVRTHENDEPRVIYAAYLPHAKISDKKRRKEMLLREAVRHFIVGGVEYAEAVFIWNKEQEEKAAVVEAPEVESKPEENVTEAEPKDA